MDDETLRIKMSERVNNDLRNAKDQPSGKMGKRKETEHAANLQSMMND